MSQFRSSRISLYAFAVLIFGYLAYYTGILNISLVYVVGFALALNGIGTFLYAYGSNRPVSLFLSVFFFNSGVVLLVMERFRLFASYPFFASGLLLTGAIGSLLLFMENPARRAYLIYTVVLFIIGGSLLTISRRFIPVDFLLWIKNIFSSFWVTLLVLLIITGYGIIRDKLS
jgi:hypothetical protein